jgi:hypothetical protein
MQSCTVQKHKASEEVTDLNRERYLYGLLARALGCMKS